jgi:hypothetical protein
MRMTTGTAPEGSQGCRERRVSRAHREQAAPATPSCFSVMTEQALMRRALQGALAKKRQSWARRGHGLLTGSQRTRRSLTKSTTIGPIFFTKPDMPWRTAKRDRFSGILNCS